MTEEEAQESKAPKKIRTFLAVVPDKATIDYLRYEQTRLRKMLGRDHPSLRWIPEDHLHLTLKFLGATPTEVIQSLCDSISEVVATLTPFSVPLRSASLFPNRRRPVVVACGFARSNDLITLANRVNQAAAACGFERDKRSYHPHLTIARLRPGADFRGPQSDLPESAHPAVSLPVGEVVLYQSKTLPEGPRYTALRTVPLGPA